MDALGVEAVDKECAEPPRLASLRRKEIQASVNDSLSSSSDGTPVGLIHPLGLGVWPPPPPGDGLLLDLRINPICSLCSSDNCKTFAMTLSISYRLRSPLGATRNPTNRFVMSCLTKARRKRVSWFESRWFHLLHVSFSSLPVNAGIADSLFDALHGLHKMFIQYDGYSDMWARWITFGE